LAAEHNDMVGILSDNCFVSYNQLPLLDEPHIFLPVGISYYHPLPIDNYNPFCLISRSIYGFRTRTLTQVVKSYQVVCSAKTPCSCLPSRQAARFIRGTYSNTRRPFTWKKIIGRPYSRRSRAQASQGSSKTRTAEYPRLSRVFQRNDRITKR
jgi:hypothetical protein